LFNQHAGDEIAPLLERLGGGELEKLELLHNELGLASARALGAANLRRLRELHVSHNPLGDEGLAAILENPTLRALEVFEAFGCGVGVETGRVLARASHLQKLRILQLGENPSDETAEAMAAASLPALRRLQLVGASQAAVERLAQTQAFNDCFVTNEWYSA